MAQVAEVRHVRAVLSTVGVGTRLKARKLAHVPRAGRCPTVSVVVPCYNYAHYLRDTVGSVTAQDGVGLEVIVVDDASTDESVGVAESIAAEDQRVRVISHASNRGHIATYNDGLSEARGDYVVLLSADDMLAPNSLRRAVDFLESEPSIGFVYGPVQWFASSSDIVTAPAEPRFKLWSGSDWLARRCRRVTNCVMSPEVVMRREVHERIGPYRSDLPHTGDLAMWLLAASVSDVGYVEGPWAAYYRHHGANMHAITFHSGEIEGMLVDLEQRRRTFQVAFDGMGGELPNAAALRGLAMRRLAGEALGCAGRAYTWGLTDDWPVDGFVAFARETWPDYQSLPQWRRLRRRQRLGVRFARKNPCFVATEWKLRASTDWTRRLQTRTGA
jgi:glycosyltransferase involved in cell wall biosynthesis